MKILDFDQRSDEWQNIRLGKFGSTDAQAVATNGKGLETLVYKKVAEIISGKADETYINPDMERGIESEALARTAYEIETGNDVKQVGYVLYNDYVGGSPDGFVGDDGIIEIKSMRDYNYIRALHSQKVEPKYLWQIQHLLYITGRKWADYVVFNDNFPDLVIVRITPDKKMFEKLEKGLKNGIKMIETILDDLNHNSI